VINGRPIHPVRHPKVARSGGGCASVNRFVGRPADGGEGALSVEVDPYDAPVPNLPDSARDDLDFGLGVAPATTGAGKDDDLLAGIDQLFGVAVVRLPGL
jgi:hypothetical protein